jgi:hypothetical protein
MKFQWKIFAKLKKTCYELGLSSLTFTKQHVPKSGMLLHS